ncbi:MAG TPA: hypothetical protein VGW32_00300, partial [Pyrinomonadaceae bacterium]|nr:hypothetical protein [Pyrinomonadaceae bacterium]
MKSRLFLFAFLLVAVSLVSAISSAQRRTETDKPITGDFKITFKTSTAGTTIQNTAMIKGQRERSETSVSAGAYTMNTVSITQCDMKRTIQINDRARKYLITPMDDGSSSGSTSPGAARTSSPATRGGVVTMTVNTVDTGERKEIMGFTARHLKRTTIMESSPDACTQQKMKIETDGWYINLEYGLTCPANRSSYSGGGTSAGGCRDRYVYKTTGPANIGYPLQETTTMYGPDGSVTMTMTKEVLEISRQPLEAALFDIPAGYSEARDQQEMYSMPSADDMTAASRQNRAESANQSQPSAPAARIRVGVVQLNNKTKTSASTDSLQQQLVAALTAQGIDAVALNAISPSEAVAEAQAKQVPYILYTDIATLKSPSTGKKIGGLFGRATGVGSGDTGKAEAKLDFRLVPTEGSGTTLELSATAKAETPEASLDAAIRSEAQSVGNA